jgi:hypothetical protein
LPLLQTNFSQFSPPQNQVQAPPQQTVSYRSPMGWSHVNAPRSPSGTFNQPKQFYATGAQPLSPPFEMPSAPTFTQVRNEEHSRVPHSRSQAFANLINSHLRRRGAE